VVAGTTGEGSAIASVRLSAWAQVVNVVTCATGVGAALASVRLVGVCSASHCGGGYDMRRSRSGLSSLGRRGLSQTLW
jgi:hypothetical protein